MFWNKKNSVKFSCIKENKSLYDALPPNYTSKFYPEWFKDLKHTFKKNVDQFGIIKDEPTIKSCPGIRATLTNGFIIPMWSDLIIDVYPDKTFNYLFSQRFSSGSVHDSMQLGNFLQDYSHLKLVSPWVAESSKSKLFYVTSPFYHTNGVDDYQIVPGFVDLHYSHTTSVFIVFKHKENPYRIFIPAGKPLVQWINTDQQFFHIEKQLISKEEWVGLDNKTITFTKTYHNFVKWFKNKQ